MKIIDFDVWVRRQVTEHTPTYTQTIDHKYISIRLFGFWWKKAIVWEVYINEFK